MKNLADALFKVSRPQLSPRCGSVLVAEPFQTEAYFNHGVALVIDYSEDEGATGVVMNNRMEYTLPDVLEDVGEGCAHVPVYCGGPLGQDRLFFVHTLGDDIIPGAREFSPGLYVGGDFDAIINYINSGYPVEGCVRFFVGYSSWERGQLEREVTDGVWVVDEAPASPETMLEGTGDRYWHRQVRKLGAGYRPWLLLPRNAECN